MRTDLEKMKPSLSKGGDEATDRESVSAFNEFATTYNRSAD